ncbi:ParA family protein [Lysinibacillus capsici]|uniref:ParA family protein n=1 Tax=Lysinibacillus capsici TaxID=2115968 RepID=UPI0034E3CE26
MKSIAVSSNKGGVLKTSITSNLASVLSTQGKKVLIIDTDNQGNIALTFGINPDTFDYTIYDVLVCGFDVNKAIVSIAPNIDIIPSNDDMSYFEIDVLTNKDKFPNPFDLLKNTLGKLKGKYDYIFVDTPPNLGLIVGDALNAVDVVITPFHPETYSLRSLAKTIKAIDNFKESNSKLKLGSIVPTKVRQTLLHKANIVSCEGFAMSNGIKITKTVIPETIAYANAIGKYRMPLALSYKTKKEKELVDVYVKLVQELNL